MDLELYKKLSAQLNKNGLAAASLPKVEIFSEHDFIVQSNLIDPQFDARDEPIPGDKPGTPMYERQREVLKLFDYFAEMKPLPLSLLKQMHRELTRGIAVFEDRNESGTYRTCDVRVGGRKAPSALAAAAIVEEILLPALEKEREFKKERSAALALAWWCHDLFQCAHPFVDGNGRTGRLFLNFVLHLFGHEKIVIWHRERWDYYQKIQLFRDTEFPRLLKAPYFHRDKPF